MEIRRLLPEDTINDVSRIFAWSWKAAYRGIVPQDYLDAIPENRWSNALAKERSDLWVVSDGGQLVGVSSCGAARDETYQNWGEIKAIYLVPAWYRKGIGTKLLQTSMQSLFDKGFTNIYLWVLEENRAARAFYEKNGFSCNGDKMPHPLGGKPFHVVRYIYQPKSIHHANDR